MPQKLALAAAATLVGCAAVAFVIDRRPGAKTDSRAHEQSMAEQRGAALATQVVNAARTADEVLISFRSGERDAEVRFRDRAWTLRLADILARAPYTHRDAPSLWVSTPDIRLYRDGAQVLELMTLGTVLRVYADSAGGDFIVGESTTRAILALAREKETIAARGPASRGFAAAP